MLSYTLSLLVSACYVDVKDSIFLKNRHCLIQERFDKLIYNINMIIKNVASDSLLNFILSLVFELDQK